MAPAIEQRRFLAADASGGRESLPDITPPEAGHALHQEQATARPNRPGEMGANVLSRPQT